MVQYFGGYGVPYPSTPFEQNYRCYSASFIDKVSFFSPKLRLWFYLFGFEAFEGVEDGFHECNEVKSGSVSILVKP